MSKIKNGGLDQYGVEPFEQQQFETAGVEGVNSVTKVENFVCNIQALARGLTPRKMSLSPPL